MICLQIINLLQKCSQPELLAHETHRVQLILESKHIWWAPEWQRRNKSSSSGGSKNKKTRRKYKESYFKSSAHERIPRHNLLWVGRVEYHISKHGWKRACRQLCMVWITVDRLDLWVELGLRGQRNSLSVLTSLCCFITLSERPVWLTSMLGRLKLRKLTLFFFFKVLWSTFYTTVLLSHAILHCGKSPPFASFRKQFHHFR